MGLGLIWVKVKVSGLSGHCWIQPSLATAWELRKRSTDAGPGSKLVQSLLLSLTKGPSSTVGGKLPS